MENKLNALGVDSCSEQGLRYSNEDTEIISIFKTGGIFFKILGVFDGHGGEFVSKIIQNELINFLVKQISSLETLENDIVKACEDLNDRILKDNKIGYSGSCGLFSLIFFDETHSIFRLITVNIGDSRGIIISGSNAKQINREHKPRDTEEKLYIELHGGEVIGNRLNGQLAVSRAFGDIDFVNSGLRVIPDIYEQNLTQSDKFIILACDGLWDVMSNDDVFNIVSQYLRSNKTISGLASELINEALTRNTTDNITVIIADLSSLLN